MAVRGWGGSVAAAIGVAAGAGAAQLGLGYGLGIIAWLPAADGASEAAWVASLTWAAWIAASSTVAGAVVAQRLTGPGSDRTSVRPSDSAPTDSPENDHNLARAADGDPPDDTGPPPDPARPAPALAGTLWRLTLAVAAAVGGLVTVALVAVPARAATRADTFSPQTIAAGYAVIGVLLGLIVAIWALHSPAVANNIVGTICWLWLLAVIAVATGVAAGRGLGTAQLGVWQITSDGERFWFRDYLYWPGAALALGSALLIGAFTARSAARTARTRIGAAVSGVAGPLLVATAYFLAAPRLVGIRAEQMSAHLMAPYAVIAGLAGSALVAALAQRRELATGQPGDPVPDPVKLTPDPAAEPPTDRDAGAGDPDPAGTGPDDEVRIGVGQKESGESSSAASQPSDPEPTAVPSTATGKPSGRARASRRAR